MHAWLVIDMATGWMDGFYFHQDYAERVRERWIKSQGRENFVCVYGWFESNAVIAEELHLPTQMAYTGTI